MPTRRQYLTALLTRQYPFLSGCASISNSRLVRALAGPDGGNAWCRVPGGEVLTDLNDFVGRSAFYMGDLDRKLSWICARIIRSGDTAFDVGANIGLITVLLSELVGPTGRVHSFEPNPVSSDSLLKAIKRNRLQNVTHHPIALGSSPGLLNLIVPNGNAGAASLVRKSSVPSSTTIAVQVKTLDDICSENLISSIRLVKLDVEGFETEVLKGAAKTLSGLKPEALLFELNERSESRFSDEPVIRLLQHAGYELICIPRNLIRMKLRIWDSRQGEPPGHDFLAVRKGPSFSEISTRLGCFS